MSSLVACSAPASHDNRRQQARPAGYGGRVVPINPKGVTIFGDEAVISIGAIDPPADLAVIVIRPDAIRDAMCEAADRGIRSLLILPGGFAEAGSVGHARDEALLKPAAERGLSAQGEVPSPVTFRNRRRPKA